jgi:predicted nucleotidyltransferase
MRTQRIRYGTASFLDLVPFGGLEAGAGAIEWPPSGDQTMSVVGFREALQAAIPVRVNGRLNVPVTSPDGLMLLKLLAWDERRFAEPGRDAQDIAYLLRNVAQIVSLTSLYEEHSSILEAAGPRAWCRCTRTDGRRAIGTSSP